MFVTLTNVYMIQSMYNLQIRLKLKLIVSERPIDRFKCFKRCSIKHFCNDLNMELETETTMWYY